MRASRDRKKGGGPRTKLRGVSREGCSEEKRKRGYRDRRKTRRLGS